MIRTFLTAALLIAATSATAQPLTRAEEQAIDALVTTTLSKTGTPSASVSVVRGGKLVFARAYGKQSETSGTPRVDVPYQIASVSKQFTAAALLLLENEGKLSLDDTVAKHLSGVSGGERITLRQLLDHTSGLQDYWPQDYSFKDMVSPVTPQGIIDKWAKKPLDFVPGTQWQYSNTGYVVAGMIAERVSGRPLLAYLDAKIFRPLGIKALDQDEATGKAYPQGYGRAALGPMRAVTPAADGWLFAAGELSMSASDLAKWNIARLDRAILPREDWETQEKAARLADGAATGYGLGVAVGTDAGRRFVEHSGEAVGFLTQNIVYPDDRAAITVLTNTWSSSAYRSIARGLAQIMLPPPAADAADAAVLARAKALFDQLRTGRPDAALLTPNLAYYFAPQVVADYRDSLLPLGAPTAFVQTGASRRRGGFVQRRFRVTYGEGGRALVVSTYAEPGENGRLEQFLIAPAD